MERFCLASSHGKVMSGFLIWHSPAEAALRICLVLQWSPTPCWGVPQAKHSSAELVKRAMGKVKEAMGGTLGNNNTIDYLAAAGEEAKEGQLLCKFLVANCNARAA